VLDAIGVAISYHKMRIAHNGAPIQSSFLTLLFCPSARKREEASEERAPSNISQAGA
jgi:hypothetical protein